MNIMLILLYVWFIVFSVLYLISVHKMISKYQQTILNILKQGGITLILFNTFNIAFSSGIHWKYSTS